MQAKALGKQQEEDEYNGVAFVDIIKILATLGVVFFGTISFGHKVMQLTVDGEQDVMVFNMQCPLSQVRFGGTENVKYIFVRTLFKLT